MPSLPPVTILVSLAISRSVTYQSTPYVRQLAPESMVSVLQ